jgi:hypothetical protein
VQSIRLHEVRIQGDRFEQERHEGHVLVVRNVAEHSIEVGRVARSVIGRQAHADEQCLSPGRMNRTDHLFQIGANSCNWEPSQAVICPQLKNNNSWLVQLQSSRQSLRSTPGRLAADAGVDDLGYVTLCLQPLLQERHPAFVGTQTVARA